MSQIPAGWHPQPDGRQRYWDGQQWTDQFAAGQGGAPSPGQGKPKRAWYAKKRFIIPGAVIALFVLIGALNGGGDATNTGTPVSAESSAPAKPAAAPAPSAEASPTSSSKPAVPSAKASPTSSSKPAAPKAPKLTSGQENALRAAENYLALMGMSKAGLIQQLSSPAGDGYSKADATFAANHVKADWNAEAVEAAKNYMQIMPMSRAALIRQLSSSAGDKFTKAQATRAADAVL
jgi:hypothetical protein